MPKVKFTCEECGKTGESFPSKPRRFCSTSCSGKYFSRATSPPRKPRTGRYDPCEVCGAPVWRRQHQIKRGTGRFCSVACHNASQIKEALLFTCEHCGLIYRLKPSQARFQSGRFCSKACEGLARIKRPLERTHNGKPARLDSDGYVWIWEPDHPEAHRYKGWMAEHRIVAERIVGRLLTKADEVHHINRVKHDNRESNLEVLNSVTHARETANQRLSDKELIAAYREKYGPLDL